MKYEIVGIREYFSNGIFILFGRVYSFVYLRNSFRVHKLAGKPYNCNRENRNSNLKLANGQIRSE